MTRSGDRQLQWEPMVRRLIVVVAVLCTLAPPVLYLLFALNEQKVGMEAEADILAYIITDRINKNPEFWRYEDIRFAAILGQHSHKSEKLEHRQLFDDKQKVVAENNRLLQPPLRTIEVKVYDAGKPVGFLRNTQSIRSILLLSIVMLLASSICGILVYFVLHSFPLKVMRAAFTALHAEKEQATITLQSISDAVIATDTSWRILSLNHAAGRMAGVQPAGAIGAFFREHFALIDSNTREKVDHLLEDCLQSDRQPCHLREQVVVVRQGDGAEFQVELTVSPLRDEKARLLGFVIVLHDVTASRSLAEQLKEKVLKLAVIVKYAGVGIAFVKEGIVQEVNAIAAEIIGLPPEAIIGLPASSILMDYLGYTEPLDGIYELMSRGELFDIEHQVVRSDQKRIWMRLIGQGVEPDRLRETGSVWIAQDITRLKQHQEELWKAKTHAEAANNFKTEFLAHVSHELRSPMTGVIGMNKLVLEKTDLTSAQREYLSIVQTSAETMLLLINNLLDLSKIEAGAMELEEKPFQIISVYNYVRDTVTLRIKEKDLSLTFTVAEDVPPVLIGDALRLGQILLNLVGNAMKFTTEGGIDVLCERLSHTGSDVRLRFKVIDSGCGIEESARQKIFDTFMQASSSVARTHGGSGLGLSICKKLTALMGGDIEVTSEPGAGSTFSFTARFRCESQLEKAVVAAGKAPAAKSAERRRQPLRILLVEDVPFNQTLAKVLLERQAHSVQVATNGIEALAALAEKPFDLIFMDILMPVMDGLKTAGLIRRCERAGNSLAGEGDSLLSAVASMIGGGRLPIIAMTGNATEADRSTCLAAGMDDYISKPFDEAEMMRVLKMVQKKHWGGAQNAARYPACC